MTRVIEMHVRYRGDERFLRLVRSEGEWHASLMMPGREDLFGHCQPRAPAGAVLARADLDDMTLKIEAPPDRVVNLNAARLLQAGGVTARDGWIEVPLHSLMRDYHDCKDDKLPEPPRAQVLKFPRRGRAREIEMDR